MWRLHCHWVAACGALAVARVLGAESAPPAPPPVEELFRAPAITSLSFSPNGRFLLCLVPSERRMNVAVIDLEKRTKNLLTRFKDKQALQPTWANNDRILFRVDDDGRESYALYAINRDGTNPVILASGYSKAETNDEVNTRFRDILGRLKDDPRSILVRANLNYIDWSDVAKLDISSGRMTLVASAPGQVDYYVLDRRNEVRFAVVQDGRKRRVMYREKSGQEWVKLTERDFDAAGWEPLVFEGDNRTVYVSSDVGRRTRAIFRYDTATHQLGELVVGDETYDVLSTVREGFKTVFDPHQNRVVGFGYKADRTRFHWLDPEMAAIHRKVESALPDTVHVPQQLSEDGSRILFFSYSDRDPGVYYLYDRTRQKLDEIALVSPQVDPERMSPVKPVVYTARDGLRLHGYLTLPKQRPPGRLPLVIHPHGGPYGPRDDWVFSPEVQFYASRGFAVLQVDYRGSGGYGRAFEAAGYRRWGLEMQDDLSDGVKWAVAEGIADPARVVISGASYGGYAAMAGLTFTPELYCAGINYVGVTDIDLLLPRDAPASMMWWRENRIGDPSKAEDRERIRRTSPVHFAERIRAPVLMAYGKNDPRVAIDHGYDMERALKRAGKDYEMIIEETEGHGFRAEERRIAFFTAVDRFLARRVLVPEGRVKVGVPEVVEGAGSTR